MARGNLYPARFLRQAARIDSGPAAAPASGTTKARRLFAPFAARRSHHRHRADAGQSRDDILDLAGIYVEASAHDHVAFPVHDGDEAVLVAPREDFWFSERYQNEAVPIRLGVGRFDVQISRG